MKKFVLSILVSVCFAAGCDVNAQVDKEIRPSLRAYASTQLAKTVITNPVIEDEDEDEELCDGSGYITHGDGHKTKCPGCSACDKEDVQPVQPVKLTRNIYHMGAKWCKPCEQMKQTTWKDEDLKKYMKDNGYQLYLLDESRRDHKKFFRYYDIKKYPTIVILDRDNLNNPLSKIEGFKDADSIEAILEGLK